MENLINIDNLIDAAKRKGIDFGKGDPYNRLRYYTKIGWLPHMTRKTDEKGGTKGHYPDWALGHLIIIEKLKASGTSNEQISQRIQIRNKFQSIRNLLSSKESRSQIITYIILISVLIILANQFEIINLGSPKSRILASQPTSLQNSTQILDSGVAFIPQNKTQVFIRSNNIRLNSKVYVTFNSNYSPASRYWISGIKDLSGFTVELDAPVSTNAEFSWWLSD